MLLLELFSLYHLIHSPPPPPPPLQFKLRLVLFLLYLVFFTIAIILRPGEDEHWTQTREEVVLRYAAEVVVMGGAVYKLFREIREMLHDGLHNYFTRQSTILEVLI